MTDGLSVDVDHLQGSFRLAGRFDASAGITALFGRSGSGKSTLVNVIAGLVRPNRGRVVLDGTVLLDTAARICVPRHRRGIGYVFQEGRLFPHLDVRQNLLFGRWFAARGGTGPRLEEVVDLLGIGALLTRRPDGLSGGEKQRVAIGRALLAKPRLLLMDEPLAALDDERRAEILPYIERLRDEAAIPIVYVSHSLAEVARLADTLIVLEGGRIAASGFASDLFSSRDISLLAEADGAGAVLDATVAAQDPSYSLTTLATPAGPLVVPSIEGAVGTRLRLRVLARDVLLSLTRPDGFSALNVLPGKVSAVPRPDAEARGPTVEVEIECAGTALLARITRKSLDDLRLEPGLAIFVVVKSVALEPDRARRPGVQHMSPPSAGRP